MSSPRVLVAGAVLGQPMGGVRRHAQELLPRADAQLRAGGGGLAVLEGSQPIAFALPPTLERLSSTVPPGPPLRRAAEERRALAGALEQAAAEGRPFDLVHTGHLPVPPGLAIPFTLMLHDLRDLHRVGAGRSLLRRLGARLAIRDAVRRAAVVLCVSDAVEAEVRGSFTPRELARVPNGIDHLPRAPRRTAAQPFLLHVGHLEPRKDLETLVRALAADPTLPPLRLAGAAKGDQDVRLLALAERLGVGARVQPLGPVRDEDLVELYAEAAAVVIPSRLEGFGIPALEALRAGVPVALSAAAARPLALDRFVPTFPVGDADACASATRAALTRGVSQDSELRTLLERHTWGAAATALVDAWCRAAGRAVQTPDVPPADPARIADPAPAADVGPDADQEVRMGARARTRDLAHAALARSAPLAWFEEVYARAAGDPEAVPWADLEPHPLLPGLLDDALAARTGSDASLRVLVVGAGLGDDAAFCAARGLDVTAFDLSSTAIAWARRRHPELAERFEVQDLFALPDAMRASFDLVVEIYTLQALPAALRGAAFRCLAETLAPGGALLAIARELPTSAGDEVELLGLSDDLRQARTEGPPWPLATAEFRAWGRANDLRLAAETHVGTTQALRLTRAGPPPSSGVER